MFNIAKAAAAHSIEHDRESSQMSSGEPPQKRQRQEGSYSSSEMSFLPRDDASYEACGSASYQGRRRHQSTSGGADKSFEDNMTGGLGVKREEPEVKREQIEVRREDTTQKAKWPQPIAASWEAGASW